MNILYSKAWEYRVLFGYERSVLVLRKYPITIATYLWHWDIYAYVKFAYFSI